MPQPEKIGRYQIHEELGRGAMGVVVRAVDSVIGRTVAIKTIRLDAFSDPAEREKLKERLLREARSAGLLSHPNIVTVYDAGEELGVAFIAMEFVAGQTVEQALRERGRLERTQVCTVIAQVAGALDYAHGKGVVHRDIKPGNLMLPGEGVKITDFGVAKILSHQATQSDLMLGTPNYMAPEQIAARGVDGRTDQFALGVIAYELLTGERPFQADSLAALLYKIMNEAPAAPHLLNATLNARVSETIARALAKQPEERFANCSAFATALTHGLAACREWQPLPRAAAGTMATVVEAVVAPPRPPVAAVEPPTFALQEPARRGWIMPLVFLAAGLAVAVGGAFHWLQPVQRQQTGTAAVEQRVKPPPAAEPVKPPDTPPPVSTVAKPAGPVSGLVEIESNPTGATVTIDDTRDQCKTPCSMELSQGRHVLRFKLDGHRSGNLAIMVPQETSASIRLDPMTGTLMVYTTPPGAQILVNGAAQKEASPATLRMTPGKYRITLRRDGARDHTQEVEVRDETITQVEFTWP